MIHVAPFEPEDLAAIVVQPAQAVARDWRALGVANAASGMALTARDDAGTILLCGGAVVVHPRYATLWSVLSLAAGPHLIALTRRVRWFVEKLDHARIDAFVRDGHAEGARWARLLGMEFEARLGGVFDDGSDAAVFRMKGGRHG